MAASRRDSRRRRPLAVIHSPSLASGWTESWAGRQPGARRASSPLSPLGSVETEGVKGPVEGSSQNYIWQMERGKFYKADSAPSEWKEGSASAKITDIEFASE